MRTTLKDGSKALASAAGIVSLAIAGSTFAENRPVLPLNQVAGNVPELAEVFNELDLANILPSLTFGSPYAYGAEWRDAYFAIGGNTVPDNANNDDVDGALGIGMGFGDAEKYVGLEVYANIISLTEGFGVDGNFNAKIHRELSGNSAVAIGVENLLPWGAAKTRDQSYYAVATKFFHIAPHSPNKLPLAVNIGIGNERFAGTDPDDDDFTLFGGLAFYPHSQVSFITDWVGDDLNAAVSIIPKRNLPITVTAGAVSLLGTDENNAEFAGGIGMFFEY